MFLAHKKENNGIEIQTLKEHLTNVSIISSYIASKTGLSKSCELLGLLHDFGKYSKAFQTYLQSATGVINQDEDEYVDFDKFRGKIDHSSAGAQYLWNYFKEKNEFRFNIAGQIMALCIASHHSGLIDCIRPDGENDFLNRMNKPAVMTYYDEVIQNADKEIINKITEIIHNSENINGIFEIFKRITAKNKKNELIIRFQAGLIVKLIFSCLIDADRIDTADFEYTENKEIRNLNNYICWDVLIDRFEKKIKEFDAKANINIVDEIRKNISDICKKKASEKQGIFTLTVPTGGGKTLASLRFALYHAQKYKLERIIYVIPYTSIIDQNAQVVREILELNPEDKGNIVLEIHSNLIPEVQNSKSKILTENWDAPIVFTTTVQFLESIFGPGTRGIRRFHQLANSVIIFDEIQTLPIKTVHLFNNTINFFSENCKTTAVLCTATQPLLNNVDKQRGNLNLLPENEIIPNVEKLFANLKRVEIIDKTKTEGWSIKEIAELTFEQTYLTKNCLVVVNTKKNAINLCESVIQKTQSIPVFHLSTNMCPAHRIKILNEVKNLLEKNKQCICISTQLIEAGVDIDFGSVIRFLAGIDSIAQAAGRCNRNGERPVSKVFIVNPKDEFIDSLMEIKVGKEISLRILNEMNNPEANLPNDLLHPKIMERYYQYFFYNRSNLMTFPIADERDDNLLNMLSINQYAVEEYIRKYNSNPPIYFRQSFKTAAEHYKSIDAPTIGIVVPYEIEGKEIIAELFSQFAFEKRFQLLKVAQRYTVNVYPNLLHNLIQQSAIVQVPEIGVYTLADNRFYHPKYGLCEKSIQEYETQII